MSFGDGRTGGDAATPGLFYTLLLGWKGEPAVIDSVGTHTHTHTVRDDGKQNGTLFQASELAGTR